MNTWLEIQHSQSSTEAGTATPITTSSTAAKGSTRQHTRRAGGGVARNKRTPRTKSGGSIAGGILDTFGPRFNRFQSVNYTALQQGDLEAGASGSSKNSSNYLSGSEHGSSSEEDIFPTRSSDTPPPRRKARRKMGRRPGYSMRDAFEEGRAMGNRTNATASCEDLLLEILLPNETTPADKMDLSITEDEVDLATPIYRLKLPLPHKVNVDRCKAKYDAELRKLCLILRLQREFDYVNF